MSEKDFTSVQHANRLKQAEAKKEKPPTKIVKEWVQVVKKNESAGPIVKHFAQTESGNVYSSYIGKLKRPEVAQYLADARKKGMVRD